MAVVVELKDIPELIVDVSNEIDYIPGYREAEEQRRTNEEKRIANENERIANEEQRRTNEEKRIANEEKRIANETERKAYYEEIQRKAEEGYFNGKQGPSGEPGKDGKDGYTPVKGVDYFDGTPGENGKDGVTPTFEVGTITTGEANVEMTEENNHYTLDFTFPEGGSGGATIRYIDLDALSSSNPLILENLELGVYALKSTSAFASLYIKAKASNTKVLKVEYVTQWLRILNYHFPISEATNGRNVVMLGPADSAPNYNRLLSASTSEASGLSLSRTNTQLMPESYLGQYVPSLTSGKTNTYASDNVFNNLPTSSATPTEDNQLVNKVYVDNLVNNSGFITTDTNTTYTLSKTGSNVILTGSDGSSSTITIAEGGGGGGTPNTQELIDIFYPVGSYYETSNISFNPNASWGGAWELEEDGTVLVSKSNVADSKFNSALGTILGEEAVQLELPNYQHLLYNCYKDNPDNDIVRYVDFTGGGYGFGAQYDGNKNVPHNNIQPSKIVNRWHRTA